MMKEKDIELCEVECIHEDQVKEATNNMLEEQVSRDLATFFKILGDPTRIKILYILSNHEMCVCDIAAVLNMNQSAISHQLRTLKSARLVKYRREGKSIYYSLDDDHVKQIFDQGLVHIDHK